ncbi:ATP-binding cassette domain-containing protein [Muricoccus aerilatus]|uniref:ATP-binding cassette domain-containing protein n=1 Tax=Muricoccus aerilatus TaxID=452982 RepID=UPI0006949425|nr:ATP-binding cassette domain-containing protein [Roseomonas aerilata]
MSIRAADATSSRSIFDGFTLEGPSFSVEGRTLLHPLSLSLPAGKVIGLIGHNGSGKSTLLKLLARQQAPTAGTVRYGARPLAAWRQRDLARTIAYLPQHTAPAEGMLARELVALGRYPWHGMLGRFTDADRDRVAEAMRLTGIEELADRQVDTLSGGERQRVWLAMLVAQDAECLLLDEPISALDIAHQVEVLSLVRRLGHEFGKSVVLVLHDVNMAARYCDEILALKGGRLVAHGTPAEIMTEPCLEMIYGLPLGVQPHPETGIPMSYVR